EKNLLLKTKDEEVANLKAHLLVKEAETTEAIRLRAEVQTLADRCGVECSVMILLFTQVVFVG
ncbi:hypothetical protein Tco_0509826, partial [Tanacetum coccineum]